MMSRATSKKTIRRLTFSELCASLIFCATYFIKIPVFSGYIHAGDGLVFLAAVFLPRSYAIAAAAIGAGLADLIGGYPLWIPITVAVRVLSILCFPGGQGDFTFISRRNFIAIALSAIITGAGYFVFESLFVYHSAIAALAGVPFNLLQSAVGAILFSVIGKTRDAGKFPRIDLK